MVSNMLGQVVYMDVVNDFDGHFERELDLSSNGTGTYLIWLRNDGKIYNKQIVVAE